MILVISFHSYVPYHGDIRYCGLIPALTNTFFDKKNSSIVTFYLRKQRARKVFGDNIVYISREINGVRELEKTPLPSWSFFLKFGFCMQKRTSKEKYQLSCYWSKEWDRCFSQGKSSYLALEMHEKGSRNGIITTSHKDQRSSHQSTEAIKLELLLDFIFERVTKWQKKQWGSQRRKRR